MTIRLAQYHDAGNLTVLSIQVWLHTYAQDGVKTSYSNYLLEHFTKENFAAVIQGPNQDIWIYETDTALQGFMIMKHTSPCPERPDCITEIDSFYVQDQATRMGIGSALLRQAVSSCKDKGIYQVWLSVHHENEIALNFYNKHNFADIGSMMFELEDGCHKNNVLLKTIPQA